MATKHFGFYGSRPKPEAVRELKASRSNVPQPDEDAILKYLQNGTQVVAVAGLAVDLLSKDGEIIGPPHEFSDGVWSWTSDVIHYVKRYHVRVPAEFVEHMRNSDWLPKPLQGGRSDVTGRWAT
jgi:hypothetical protein